MKNCPVCKKGLLVDNMEPKPVGLTCKNIGCALFLHSIEQIASVEAATYAAHRAGQESMRERLADHFEGLSDAIRAFPLQEPHQ